MFNPWKFRVLVPRLLALAVAGIGMCGAHAQVQFFDRVPTPDEITTALLGSVPADVRTTTQDAPRFKSRGVEWNSNVTNSEDQKSATRPSVGAIALPVKFDSGAARVSAASIAYLDAVATALIRNPELRLSIEGHTDAVGSARVNVMLSWERAFSVFRLMVEKHGIDPSRLQPVGKGASEPLVATDEPNAMNRRVQFRPIS
jgi:outer membrane protein OmpA-like peptidoglycan-associated protein